MIAFPNREHMRVEQHRLHHENFVLRTQLNDLERENMLLRAFVFGAVATAITLIILEYWT